MLWKETASLWGVLTVSLAASPCLCALQGGPSPERGRVSATPQSAAQSTGTETRLPALQGSQRRGNSGSLSTSARRQRLPSAAAWRPHRVCASSRRAWPTIGWRGGGAASDGAAVDVATGVCFGKEGMAVAVALGRRPWQGKKREAWAPGRAWLFCPWWRGSTRL